MENLTLLFLILIFYTYFGYTILIILLGAIRNKSVSKKEIYPTVSLLIAAYNEEKGIKEKLLNSLLLDYPKEKLEIYVVSDGSTDKTDEIVNSFTEPNIHLLRVEGRVGKTQARNIAMKQIKSEITVFSDGTTEYDKNVIRKLVQNFNDKTVGMVTGHLKYADSNNTQMGMGQKLYWQYETLIKKSQTKLGTLTGSIGCITAFRTHLYSPLPSNVIEDFTEPLFFVKKGYRVVFEPEAICFEETTKKSKNEFNMRIRVIRGGITGLLYAKSVLNPFKYPIASFQLISHKVFRWLIPVFALLLLTCNLLSFSSINNFFGILLILQFLFYSLSFLSYLLERVGIHNKILAIPLYLFVLNLASLIALFKTFTSRLEATWEPER